MDRHLMAVNIGRFDGSVARTAIRDLWAQPWHATYQRKIMTPP
jgi:hypothetical protein